MKAEIDSNGCLYVQAESATESYALKHWWMNFNNGETAALEVASMMCVRFHEDPESPNLSDCI